jgi:tetratricopeptide (TPR) repeat protein
LNSQVPAFHSNLGLALQAQGKLKEAVASYRRALAHKPDDAYAHTNLGSALKQQGELEEAVALHFYSALARQCYINEYVFSLTDEEIQKASDLRDSLASALESGAKVSILWPVGPRGVFSAWLSPTCGPAIG